MFSRRGDFIPHILLMGRCIKGLAVRVVRACNMAVFFGLLLSPKHGEDQTPFAADFPWRRQAGVGESPGRRVQVADEAARAEAVGEGIEAPHEVKIKSRGTSRTYPRSRARRGR